MLQSTPGELGGVTPNDRLFSQSYPSIYSSVSVSGAATEQNANGERERERSSLEAERERQRAGIVDLEEEGEDEEDEDDMDERQPYGHESAGETDIVKLFFITSQHKMQFSYKLKGVSY